jgi:hypothetical protein
MADFNIRSDSVDVEQIMTQIRARIQEKRGVDYTEEQVRELATVRLEKFLDPKNLRSDLLEQFRRSRPAIPADPAPVEPPYRFSDETLYETHRGILRLMRRVLNPILKLFFNPNPLITAMHKQEEFNVDLLKREQRRKIEFDRSRADWNALYYEVLHNLVLETTRNGIEMKNLKMRVEALASRLDFSERRVRALEGVVQYRPEIVRPRPTGPREGQRGPQQVGRPREEREGAFESEAPASRAEAPAAPTSDIASGQAAETVGRRRRRRRRGRRGTGVPGASSEAPADQTVDSGSADEEFDGGDEGETDGDPQSAMDDTSDGGDTPRDAEPVGGQSTSAPVDASPSIETRLDGEDEPPTPPSDPHAR